MNMAHDYTATILNEVRAVEQSLHNGEFMVEWLDQLNVFDFEYTLSSDGKLRSVRLIRTVGGPRCTIDFYGYGQAEVTTVWGSERDVQTTPAPVLEDLVFDFIEDVQLCGRMSAPSY